MTEENKEVVPEQSQEQAPELSPIEQQALEMGWKPRDAFEGSDDEFIDAKEYVRRKPLFDRLEQQSKQLKNVNKTLEQLKTHYTKMREVEFNRALSELKNARKQSISDGDGDRFEVLDDQIKKVEQEAAQVMSDQDEVPTSDPAEFKAWTAKNSWYQQDEAMTAYADRVGLKHKEAVAAGELTPLQVLQKVEQAVRAEFPQKFRNPNKDTAPSVGESKASGRRADSFKASLNETERKIMNNFVRSGIMTEEQYLKDLKAAKGVA